MNIKPEYYKELDEEFKIKYRKYVRVDPDNRSYNLFTENEQIERHARNVAFWQKEMNEARCKLNFSDGKACARTFMTSNNYSTMVDLVKHKFNQTDQKTIMDRVKQLLDEESPKTT